MIYEIEIKRRIIGTIEFGENLSEQVIGNKKNIPIFKNSFKGKCVIEIYGYEGNSMPHFHITSVDKKFSCCICIFDNRFFTHGKHKDVLARKDWKVLDEWMRKDNDDNKDETNWERIVEVWNMSNGTNYKNNDIELDYDNQPDYTTIKPYKEK